MSPQPVKFRCNPVGTAIASRIRLIVTRCPGYLVMMKLTLCFLPLLAMVGCDLRDGATPSGKVGTTTSVGEGYQQKPEPNASAEVAKAGKPSPPPVPPNAKDPPSRPPEFEERKEEPPEEAPPIPESFKALNKGKTIFFEKKEDGTRLVHVLAEVCLREGFLEVLLCRNHTKEHESILRTDADAREIHFALVTAGAKPGSPVKFVPKYTAATGSQIKVSMTYREKGKVKTATAGEWIKDKKTGKDMAHNWVFAGSKFFQDPERPEVPPYYTANNGEFISMANFPDSMLDLPVESPKDVVNLIFEIHTERIPPLRTPVIVTLQPVIEKKK